MALPLPKVIPDVGPGGGINTAFQGALASGNALLKNQLLGQQSQYYPLTTALQAVSNPLTWAYLQSNPAAQSAVSNMMGNAFRQMGSQGGSSGGGLLGTISNKLQDIFGGTPSTNQSTPNDGGMGAGDQAPEAQGQAQPNAFNQTPDATQGGGSPLVPASQGLGAGIAGKMLAGYEQQPYSPGADVQTADGIISVPTGGSVDTAQTSLNAINRVLPIMDNIIKDAPRYLGSGEAGKIKVASQINQLEKTFGTLGGIPDMVLDKLNIDKEDVSGYQNLLSNATNAAESIMKTGPLPPNAKSLDAVSGILNPRYDETAEGYVKRMQKQKDILMRQRNYYTNMLRGGFPLNGQNQQQGEDTQGAQVRPNEPNKAEVAREGVVPYVTLRNKKTGQTLRMSRDEAMRGGYL